MLLYITTFASDCKYYRFLTMLAFLATSETRFYVQCRIKRWFVHVIRFSKSKVNTQIDDSVEFSSNGGSQ